MLIKKVQITLLHDEKKDTMTHNRIVLPLPKLWLQEMLYRPYTIQSHDTHFFGYVTVSVNKNNFILHTQYTCRNTIRKFLKHFIISTANQ